MDKKEKKEALKKKIKTARNNLSSLAVGFKHNVKHLGKGTKQIYSQVSDVSMATTDIYKKLNSKLKTAVAVVDKNIKEASVATNKRLGRVVFVGGNMRWLLLMVSSIFLFVVELASLIAIGCKINQHVYLLSHTSVYGKWQLSTCSLVVGSCFTHLVGFILAYFFKHTVTWSGNGSIVVNYMVMITCQLVAILTGISLLGMALKNLSRSMMPHDLLPVLTVFSYEAQLAFTINRMHQEHSCCGITGPEDWTKLNSSVPHSCCYTQECMKTEKPTVDLHGNGCYDWIMDQSESDIQFRVAIFGMIILLQIPVFFLTWLSLPDFTVVKKFFWWQTHFSREIKKFLRNDKEGSKQKLLNANAQNANVCLKKRYGSTYRNASIRYDLPRQRKDFGKRDGGHKCEIKYGNVEQYKTNNSGSIGDCLNSKTQMVQTWLFDNKFFPRLDERQKFQDFKKQLINENVNLNNKIQRKKSFGEDVPSYKIEVFRKKHTKTSTKSPIRDS